MSLHDEFHDLSDVNFVSSLFAIFPDGIEHLGLWVCGKADKGVKKYLKVVTDQEYPHLDAVSVSLVYLWLIGWKGGYMFPSSGKFTHNLIMVFTAQPFVIQQQ